jgi:hypothetical protein
VQESRERGPGNRDRDLSLDGDFELGYRVGELGLLCTKRAGVYGYLLLTFPSFRFPCLYSFAFPKTEGGLSTDDELADFI